VGIQAEYRDDWEPGDSGGSGPIRPVSPLAAGEIAELKFSGDVASDSTLSVRYQSAQGMTLELRAQWNPSHDGCDLIESDVARTPPIAL
jgi:hypothetical protein